MKYKHTPFDKVRISILKGEGGRGIYSRMDPSVHEQKGLMFYVDGWCSMWMAGVLYRWLVFYVDGWCSI